MASTRRHHLERLEPRAMFSTYYVGTAGSNAAAGSPGAPWQTLQYAADHVHAGDTIIVTPGHYVGFDLRTSGTAAARITFKGQSGAIIDAVNTVTKKDGINVENASYVTIDGFTLVGTNDPSTSRAGIRVVGDGFDQANAFSKNVVVQNNSADRWGIWGIFTAFSDDMVIENNVCSRSAQQHGIYFSNSADRPTIRNNTCWGNANCGIHVNADINTGDTSLPGVDGIITGALIDGNICYGNGGGSSFSAGGGSAINCDGVQNSRITNNLLYDNHSTGIALFQIDGAAASKGDVVANNTIINAADSRFCLLVTNAATNTTVFNNIFFNLSASNVRGSIELSADSTGGFKSDDNLLDARFSYAETVEPFAAWKSHTAGDAHSQTITSAQMQALFTNYAGHDFTLAANSGAIDKGTSGLTNGVVKPAPTFDLLKLGRPAGAAWDIGAYERGGVAFGTVINGKLTITGTAGSDSISITLSAGSYTVTRSGASAQFAASAITGIDVFAYDGDDAITIGTGVLGAYVDAGAGNDFIQGGDGNDTITAGAGKDRVFGGLGDDRLNGSGGHDKLNGEAGKDRLYGGEGNDTLDGGSSSDRLWGEAGNNTYYGQGGDDYLFARNGAADILYGQAGNDHAQIDAGVDAVQTVEDLLA